MSAHDADRARAALGRALAARPSLDGAALTEATQALCRLRDGLRRTQPGDGAARRQLKDINALITLVHAVHYPLGATPWDLLEQARPALDGCAPPDPSADPELRPTTQPP